jgi:hypothetical protein
MVGKDPIMSHFHESTSTPFSSNKSSESDELEPSFNNKFSRYNNLEPG